MCNNILKHIEEIKEWVLWNQTAKETEDSGLAVIVDAYQKGMDHDDIMGAYKKTISKGLASRAIDASKTLNSFSGKLFDQKVDRFITLDKQISELGNREIVYRLAAKLPDFTREAAQSSELGILQRAIKSGGRGTSLRKLFGQIPNLLPRLCPCMLMSPISVAQYIDPNKSPFDLVIFDEASQLTTSKAVGVLARGQNAVIVGDPKQMTPTSFFYSAAVDERARRPAARPHPQPPSARQVKRFKGSAACGGWKFKGFRSRTVVTDPMTACPAGQTLLYLQTVFRAP